jgi:hypothetical protein
MTADIALLNVPTPSLASQLLQGVWHARRLCSPSISVGAGLPAMNDNAVNLKAFVPATFDQAIRQ